ncbi:hypothetical protein CTI12_AA164670 [Artemisia annua]|uniref:FAR1 DNA binding domain-containing protein n=2 Tax=Artemisia annua TaxID=35608 RepID=A0A2U1PDE7_ARTAN|nr:hypothetical protein CTI12_AA164670 [Artemisia annua]
MDENRNLIDVIDENKLIEVSVDVADTGDVVDDLQDLEEVLPEDLKMEEGCEIVIVRDRNAAPYRTLNKEIADESETAAQTVIDYKVSTKGNITEAERNKRRKSEREKALGVKKKQMKKCGHCGEKTNTHTKTTCPLNPKAKRKAPTVDA